MRLILVRHGNTFEKGETPIQIGARTDLSLTSFGVEQAKKMLSFLKGQGISIQAIFAGSLKRQQEFAHVIADGFSLKPLKEPALTEIDYGKWEGLSEAELSTKWPDAYKLWREENLWPEGIFESDYKEKKEALLRWTSSLRQKFNEDKAVLGVTSGGVLRLIQPQKVKTGHFVDLEVLDNEVRVQGWNILPVLSYIG